MAFLDGLSAGLDAFKLGYNLYTNNRDFDYQRALQQQIFEREDTAVQRRAADLQAAGMNPNLAAGSAASAGSAVARSNTNDLGSALDTIQALNSIRQQKQQTENAEVENKILKSQKEIAEINELYSKIDFYQNMGIFDGFKIDGNGEPVIIYDNNIKWKNDIPLQLIFDNQFNSLKNSADIIQKQNNWFTTNQILGAAGSLVNDIADIGGLFKPKFYKGRYQK